MGSAAQENGDQLDAEDVADSASSSPASLSNGSVATLSSNQASRSINGNSRRSTVRSRQLSEDAALFRVLQRLDSSSRPPPGVSSTSTVRPLSSFSSTRAAISLSSSTSYSASAISLTTRPTAVGSLDDSDLEDNEDDEGIEDTDEIEFEEVEVSPEDSEAQDSALDRLRERLRTLKLEQEDIILAFRGFVRRFHDYLDSYNERLFEYVNSEEFEAQIDRLREAVRQYDEEHPHEDHEEEEGEAPGGPLPPGRRTTTTTEAPGGSSTTLAAADGSSTTLAAADGSSTTLAAADGSSTTLAAADGSSTTLAAADGSSTTLAAAGGSSTTLAAAGGILSTTRGGVFVLLSLMPFFPSPSEALEGTVVWRMCFGVRL
ncbi:hypothetical protein cyc_03440 [Cyclospora cayetanensis]|uniref:Uncharacterized protein n=1 Tax=Cyclospora cayetanensis TaxID=88456 RepID=A0A1D3D154_9EIME|nr:hypothetical protein cyc_03440 [Cyclospora cayetanensis]